MAHQSARGFFCVFLVWMGVLGTMAASADPADLLLVNGKIITLDAASSVTEALAIQADHVAATGSTEEVRKLAGPSTKTIDLGGRTVIPGLIDSHIHAIRAGFRFATEVDWEGATDIKEALARLRAAATREKPDAWLIVGGGWTPRQFAENRRPTEDEIASAAELAEHPGLRKSYLGH